MILKFVFYLNFEFLISYFQFCLYISLVVSTLITFTNRISKYLVKSLNISNLLFEALISYIEISPLS